ncbi:hypothetical protein B0A78_08565 [Flavobacterium columnare NBRC 100251 = ATCC 23463]|uniref:Uncharacterized protein n=3 Tax=Flavobacterium columnare TaxID=996 RepID=G8XAP9_FLACA|nr:hypothetical protein [Flavobacterium columnare]AEW87355.1 hypothetical protein FCOL_12800 [Flavobacterium columnare ATCC 49512]PDS23760.1 hypothetical protein B0A78_08565 [Flavobacterium columnare NBRC 100251 = ATCC 23463]MBF6652570.1 hypothetical protein [Flavobacterium columnare]MBF6655583.1 hypothetical protein [Flavobacterium columnare]MBF6658438.1 hypothetical protein [Flavobacterium columnare]
MGIFIFWLFTPGDGELRPAEKILFEKVKSESKALDIWREPKYHISDPRDSVTYRLIIRKKESNINIDLDSLKIKAKDIAIEIENKLNLNSKFINYEIIYEYVRSGDKKFKFKRTEIKKLNIKK